MRKIGADDLLIVFYQTNQKSSHKGISLFLPFLRRRLSTFLPESVRILFKNPCLRRPTILVGVVRRFFIFNF